MLDGTSDCHTNSDGKTEKSHDEQCPFHHTECPLQCVSLDCKCSPLHFKNTKGVCLSYTRKQNTANIPHNAVWFNCTRELINVELVNDLVPDCGPSAADELKYKALLSNYSQFECEYGGGIPCTGGHSKYFDISQTCTFELDTFGHLSPCRTGSHLESCIEFECNIQFKCPKNYCVPWHYVCDGKWDCPHGFDENHSLERGKNRICKGLYKCKSSRVCIHIQHTCDGRDQCPKGDDEKSCQLKHIQCHKACHCLNFALSCIGSLVDEEMFHNLPHMSFHLVNTSVKSLQFLQFSNFTVSINMPSNQISQICGLFKTLSQLRFVNLTSNHVNTLHRNCFCNLFCLSTIILAKNTIQMLEMGSFVNLSKTKIIDCSHNEINSLTGQIFVNISQLHVLNLSFNHLMQFDQNTLRGIVINKVITSSPFVCCIPLSVTSCEVVVTSYETCSDLLHGVPLRVVVLVIVLCVMRANFASSSIHYNIQHKARKKSRKTACSGNYEIIVCTVCFANTIFADYLFVLWVADLYYNDEFMMKSNLWQQSFFCSVAHMFSLLFCLILPFLFSFLSFSRLMVTLYPMNSSFKQRSFVVKQLTACIVLLAIISSTVTVHTVLTENIKNKFCSPFVHSFGFSLKANIVTIFVASVQVGASVFISVFYVLLFVKLAQNQMTSIQANSQVKSIKPGVVKAIILTTFNFCCWSTLSAFHILLLFVFTHKELLVLLFVITTNSFETIVNPIFFIVTLKKDLTQHEGVRV